MNALKIVPGKSPGSFELIGEISEQLDLSPLFSAPQSHLILDLKKIRRLNSVGTREWIYGLNALQKQGKTLEFQNCSYVFVDSCITVGELVKGCILHSLELGLYCEECDEETLQIFDVETLKAANLQPSIACSKCKGALEFEQEIHLLFKD